MRHSLLWLCAKGVCGSALQSPALQRHGGDWSKLWNDDHKIEVLTEVLRDLRKEQLQSLKVEFEVSHPPAQGPSTISPAAAAAVLMREGGGGRNAPWIQPTKEMFLHFLDECAKPEPYPHMPGRKPLAPIAVIPAAEGTGGTTTLRQTEQWLKERFPTATFLFVPGNISSNKKVTAENVSVKIGEAEEEVSAPTTGRDHITHLRFRVLNAAIGAPPGALDQTAKVIRQRLGLSAKDTWEYFLTVCLGRIFNETLRAALDLRPHDHLLIAVDDAARLSPLGHHHQPPHCIPFAYPPRPPSIKTGKAVLFLTFVAPDTLFDESRHRGKGRVLTVGVTEPEFLPEDFFFKSERTQPLYRLRLPLANPAPFIDAACERLCLVPDSQRAQEVRYMLRHAAVHARFLADVFEALCDVQGPPLTVADFDAHFEAFVGERITSYIRHCEEQNLLPSHLFHFLVNRLYVGKFAEASAVVANALGLCEIHWPVVIVGSCRFDDRDTDWIGPRCIYIHPKVFVMLHDALQVHQSLPTSPSLEQPAGEADKDDGEGVIVWRSSQLPPNVTGPPSPRPLAMMLALARRINTFTAMSPKGPLPGSSPTSDAVQCLGDITVLLFMTCLAHDDDNIKQQRRAIHKDSLPERILLSTLFPLLCDLISGWNKFKQMKLCGSPHQVFAFPQHTSSFTPPAPQPMDATFGGLLTDPVIAPRSLRLMHQHGIISGALHKLETFDPQLHMTIGIVAIAESTPDGTAAAITELRRKRAAWAVEAAANPTTPAAYPWAASRAPPPSATAKLLQTTLFLHVFVVAVAPPDYVPQPFSVGTAQCFETLVTLDHLRSVCPMVGSFNDGLYADSEVRRSPSLCFDF